MTEHYENTMTINKTAQFGDLTNHRHERDKGHQTDYRTTKETELEDIMKAREEAHK